MQVLFDATRPVKPASRNFGRGIAPARTARFVPSMADQQWAAETSPFADREFDVVGPSDAVIEEAAREAELRARCEAGYVAC